MRIEFERKVYDVEEEELEQAEKLNMPIKDAKFKWQRMYVLVEDITGVFETGKKSTQIEFSDLSKVTVKGAYDEVKKKIDDAEAWPQQEEDLAL